MNKDATEEESSRLSRSRSVNTDWVPGNHRSRTLFCRHCGPLSWTGMSAAASQRCISVKFVMQGLIGKRLMRKTSTGPTEHLEKQTANRLRASATWDQMARKSEGAAEHQKSQRRDINKHTQSVHTYIDHIGDVVDVVFCHDGIRRRQVQQIVVPGFCAFQLILWILGLPLERRDETEQARGKKSSAQENHTLGFECVKSVRCRFGTCRLVEMTGNV